MHPSDELNSSLSNSAARAEIRRRIASGADRTFAILILSGSFNPIHVDHIHCLELARSHAESHGWTVLAGFLAPSTDSYVRSKCGEDALSFEDRKTLCETAIDRQPWLSVCSKPELSSNSVRSRVVAEIQHDAHHLLHGRKLAGFEIMGADTLNRILERTASSVAWPDRSDHRHRTIYWFSRAHSEGEPDNSQPPATSLAGQLGIQLVHVNPGRWGGRLLGASSQVIRAMIREGDWAALRAKHWLPPEVFACVEGRGFWAGKQ
jgi:nicotinic acid mononucleotide adenylyltransferase